VYFSYICVKRQYDCITCLHSTVTTFHTRIHASHCTAHDPPACYEMTTSGGLKFFPPKSDTFPFRRIRTFYYGAGGSTGCFVFTWCAASRARHRFSSSERTVI
jgi:hypothetical protein